MKSNILIKVLRINLKNGAYIDAESGDAYDCSGQMITHLPKRPLGVLCYIAKCSVSLAKGIVADGATTNEILDAIWPTNRGQGNVSRQVMDIRRCLGLLYPEKKPEQILLGEKGGKKSEFKYVFSSEYCLIVTDTYIPISVNLAELYAIFTKDYAGFENNGDGFAWLSDCFESVFFKNRADSVSLAKRVLFFTGNCFREKEQQIPNCCESLATLFCSDNADDIVLEKFLSFCLSSERVNTEKADHDRMIKTWEHLEKSLSENVRHSYQASHWMLGVVGHIPTKMADVDMAGNPFAGNAKDDWYNALKATLAVYIQQKFSEYLKDLKRETNLSRAEQKCGPDIIYSYIVAMVLFCLNNATAKSTGKKDFFEKRERYWKALETSIQEKLPPEDLAGNVLDSYYNARDVLPLNERLRLALALLKDIIDGCKGYSRLELEPILKNIYDELKSLGQKNVESETEGQRISLSQTLKK